MRMARIPQGASLVPNPTGGPQGFRMDNVFVMAGIPAVMQAMLSTLGDQLEGGSVVHSRSVTAHLGESEIADGLEDIQRRYPHIDLGSYPFYRDNVYGTTLVMRGADETALEHVLAEVRGIIEARGAVPRDP